MIDSFLDDGLIPKNRAVDRDDQVRDRSREIIARVVKTGVTGIDLSLAIGAACPFAGRRDLQIWAQEAESARTSMGGMAA